MAYANIEDRRAYHNNWHKQQYANNPAYKAAFDARHRLRAKRRDQIVANMMTAFKATGCGVCGETAACCLVAHHINSAEKDFALSTLRWSKYGVDRVRHELTKCACLCANCHMKLHASVITVERKTLRIAAKRAMARVMAVVKEAREKVATAVRAHHENRKRRHGLERTRTPKITNGFKLPLALKGLGSK